MTLKKQTIILIAVIIAIVVAIPLTGMLYFQKYKSNLKIEEVRCNQFSPHDGNYDNKSCINAGCKGSGHGEWSCVPDSPLYRYN